MQNQSYDHSYAEEAYDYDAERDAQSNRSRDENSRERDHHQNDGERDGQRVKSRDENSRERDNHRNDGDRERDGQRYRSRDENSRERDHQRNEISNGKSKLNAKDKTGRIPWSVSQQTALMRLVLHLGVHKCNRNGVVRLWNKLNSSLFNQPEFVDYKDMHYKANDYRKIRDKYNALLESVQNDIDRGNQSGKEGDLSLLYQFVQQIQKTSLSSMRRRRTKPQKKLI